MGKSSIPFIANIGTPTRSSHYSTENFFLKANIPLKQSWDIYAGNHLYFLENWLNLHIW